MPAVSELHQVEKKEFIDRLFIEVRKCCYPVFINCSVAILSDQIIKFGLVKTSFMHQNSYCFINRPNVQRF